MTGPNRTEIDRLRETVAWMAQTVHQAHHSTGSWQEFQVRLSSSCERSSGVEK